MAYISYYLSTIVVLDLGAYAYETGGQGGQLTPQFGQIYDIYSGKDNTIV